MTRDVIREGMSESEGGSWKERSVRYFHQHSLVPLPMRFCVLVLSPPCIEPFAYQALVFVCNRQQW